MTGDVDVAGDQLAAISGLMSRAGEDVAGPLRAAPLLGGRSNVMFRLDDGISQWVLRMPPPAGRTPSAHDIAREHRVTTALMCSPVPVARPVLLCQDESVIGSPFMVAEFVPGRTIQSAAALAPIGDGELGEVVRSLVVTLAALHAVTPMEVGLQQLGRPHGYSARQVATWSRQWELVGTPQLGSLQLAVQRLLARREPVHEDTVIVHGDYRLDNTLVELEPVPRVVAVVDWELSTLGVAAADVATMCAYRHEAFDLVLGQDSAWTSPRLPSVEALADLYEAAAGRPLQHWEFHLALAHYKIAVISAGIAYRQRLGSGADVGHLSAAQAVEPYLETAHAMCHGV